MEGKYVTFKAEALDKLLVGLAGSLSPTVGEALNEFVSAALDDAVVIRLQDNFAPPALDSYANSIMSAVLLLETSGVELDMVEVGRLKEIADYFHTQAVRSWQINRKLPD